MRQTDEIFQRDQAISLYPLPAAWKWVTVNDAGAYQKNAIVDGPFGSNLKVSDYVEGGPVPVLTTKNLDGNFDDVRHISKSKFEELKRSAVYPGDILVAKIGSCGRTGIYPMNKPPAMIPANLLKVTLNDQFELKFVYYYFNSTFFQKALRAITKATAQPAFGVTNFRKLPLPFVERGKQRHIVAEIEKQFSRLDEAVASLKRTKANLKRYKASVLKAAVEGKLTEDWRKQHPNVEPASKLLERILAERRAKWNRKGKYKEPLHPDARADSHLPGDWIWVSVDQLSSLVTDGDHNPPKRVSAGVPHLTAKHIKKWRISLEECSYISQTDYERTRSRFEPLPGDLIVTCVGTVGQTAIVPAGITFSADRNLAGIRLLECGISAKFLQFVLNTPDSQAHMRQASGSTAQPHLYLGDLRVLAVPLPSLAEQHAVVDEVERRLSVIDELEASVEANLTRANRLRHSILQKAFAGRLVSQCNPMKGAVR